MRVPSFFPVLILALAPLGGGCAAKNQLGSPPSASYDAAMGGAELSGKESVDAMGAPAPAAGYAGYADDAMGAEIAMPAAVMGSVAPKRAAPSDDAAAEQAIADYTTTGADSVDQMLIFTGQLAIEIGFATTPERIDAAVAIAVASGGYVAELTDTALRLRVPSKRFRKAMKEVEALGDVRSRGVQALDVSEEFHDMQVRLDNLKATRSRIEKLLAQSKDLTEILTVEKELERVTVEIDRIEGRMRLLSSQAAFSTIAVAFSERPADNEVKVIAGGDAPPAASPRTLASSAGWIGEVGVFSLMNFDAASEGNRR